MREIKCRGKGLKDNKWYYGYYWTNENGNYFIRKTIDLNECFTIEDIEIIPETIGQYTGLNDKNGIEIYEGDIVEAFYFEAKVKGKIDFIYGAFAIIDSSVSDNQLFIFKDIKVIGNTIDNPELLEKE